MASLEGYPAKAISVRLLRAREAVMAHVRPLLRRHGFTEQQYRVMRTLQNEAPLDNATIAMRATLLPPSVTRILADLQARGLVEDLRDNGRWVRAQLTPRGRAAVEAAAAEVDEVGAMLTARLGAERMRELERMLEEVEACLPGPGGE
ncbi:MarR family transcriptional regulator [Roseomonas chloroacetimidivorans]|uniref:MarR family transcriptional regulator n=1 Tax=Roseomonas chloroacetimidivorans TaxID=1766656 RepID=UPI003C74FB61